MAIKVQTKFEKRLDRLAKAAERAKQGSLSSAAFLVREAAIDSIRISKRIRGYFYKTNKKGEKVRATYYEPSPPGQPILGHRKGKGFFRRGIKYSVDRQKQDAMVGFSHDVFAETMSIHEHGLSLDGKPYDKRPTMQPALEKSVDKFHRDWRASIS
jgi:predicted transcriptional regulator